MDPEKRKLPKPRTLRIISVTVAVVLLATGVFLVSVSPHTTSSRSTLAEMNNFHLNGYPPETLQQSADNIYRSVSGANISKGQSIEVSWYADLFLGVYIFSEEQYAHFQSVLPNMDTMVNTNTSNYAKDWAEANGITYQAVGFSKRGEASLNVTQPGNYVAVITNAMYGAAYATVWDFDVCLISYKEASSVYLYLGVFFVILGIALLALALAIGKSPQTRFA